MSARVRGHRRSSPVRRLVGSRLNKVFCRSRLAAGISVIFALALVLAPSASALSQRPFKEIFGTAAQPTFGEPEGMAVDSTTGDLYVIDYEDQTLSRYHEDGTLDLFSALSGNVIDGP